MKWYKHDTDAIHDPKIRKLIQKFGLTGYGLFFALLELIGNDMERDTTTYGLLSKDWDTETLAVLFRENPDTVGTISDYLVELGLFTKKDSRLFNQKIIERCDEYTEKMLRSRHKIPTKSRQYPDPVGTKSGIEQNRTEQNRREENRTTTDRVSQKIINSLVLTKGQITVFLKEFPGVTTSQLKEQSVKCSRQMAMSSSSYTNPGLYFRGWMKKYYSEWKQDQAKKEYEAKKAKDMPDMTPEQIASNRKRIEELKSKFPVKNIPAIGEN